MSLWGFSLVLFVFLVILNHTVSLVKDDTFETNYLARDMAMYLDAVYAVPGDAQINYPENTLGFVVNVKENRVEFYDPIYSEGPVPDLNKGIYWFTSDTNYALFTSTLEPEQLKDGSLKSVKPVIVKDRVGVRIE